MARFEDRVKDTTTTTGTGDITVAGTPPTGFQGFSVFGVGDIVSVAVVHQTANEWEIFVAPMSSSTVIQRSNAVLTTASSTGGTPVSFSAGTKDVFVTISANDIDQRDSRSNNYAHRLFGAF